MDVYNNKKRKKIYNFIIIINEKYFNKWKFFCGFGYIFHVREKLTILTGSLFAYLFGIICRRLWDTERNDVQSLRHAMFDGTYNTQVAARCMMLQPGKSIIVRDTLRMCI